MLCFRVQCTCKYYLDVKLHTEDRELNDIIVVLLPLNQTSPKNKRECDRGNVCGVLGWSLGVPLGLGFQKVGGGSLVLRRGDEFYLYEFAVKGHVMSQIT
jgi:hypothetical protein